MGPGVRIKCPTCRKAGFWMEKPLGPFCSERCKLVDLGKWLGGEHRISSRLQAEDLDFFPIEGTPVEPGAERGGE